MKSFATYLEEEDKPLKVIRGLHQAQVGDHISIGIQGVSGKFNTKIVKIAANDRLQDQDGNVFGRNGIIFRKSPNSRFRGLKDKIISAKIITQKEFDKQYKKTKINFLRKYDWDKEDEETILKVIDMLKMGQGNTKGKSRFKF